MRRLAAILVFACLFLILGASSALAVDAGWQRAANNGFGVAGNQGIFYMTTFNGELYASATNNSGMQIWSSTDGLTWVPKVGPGATMPAGYAHAHNNLGGPIISFGGHLVAGVGNGTDGCEVWSTTTADGTNWQQDVAGGFGDDNNISISSMVVYNGHLYAATINSVGSQVYESDDGHGWSQVVPAGYGLGNNSSTLSLQEFNGNLYASTYDYLTAGASVFSSANASVWTSVVGYAPSVYGPGFGNSNNWGLRLGVFNNALYAASRCNGGTTSLWKSDGLTWTLVPGYSAAIGTADETYRLFADDGVFFSGAGYGVSAFVFASGNGDNWTPISLAAFGDDSNTEVLSFQRFGEYVYASTYNDRSGAQIWRVSSTNARNVFWPQGSQPQLPYSGR